MQLGREGHWCECGLLKGERAEEGWAPIPVLRERLACYGWGKGREVKADERVSQGGSSCDSSRGGASESWGAVCAYMYLHV